MKRLLATFLGVLLATAIIVTLLWIWAFAMVRVSAAQYKADPIKRETVTFSGILANGHPCEVQMTFGVGSNGVASILYYDSVIIQSDK